MKILFVHNYYQHAGGEDQVLKAEMNLIKSHGHKVEAYTVHNDQIQSTWGKLKIAWYLPYSQSSYSRFSETLKKVKPDVVHCHNFFPLLTPSIFDACKDLKIATVMTLHNYRLICPSATLMRHGKPWELSIKKSPYWTVPYKVYKDSLFGTAALARMIQSNRKKGTWTTKLDRIITLTQFSKNKYISAGFSPNNIVVKPNFIPDPIDTTIQRKNYAVFIGRLSSEKGVEFLLNFWPENGINLKIIGSGPLSDSLSKDCKNVSIMGPIPNEDVKKEIRGAQFLVMTSQWYEGFPMVLVEALACGTPALVTKLGGMAEIIDHEQNGLHFELGNKKDFIDCVIRLSSNSEWCKILGENGRKKYELFYTPEKNYQQLNQIYLDAIQASHNQN